MENVAQVLSSDLNISLGKATYSPLEGEDLNNYFISGCGIIMRDILPEFLGD